MTEYMKNTARLAIATAVEVFLAVILASSLMSWNVSTAKQAGAAAVGAGLSVVYNAVRELKNRYQAKQDEGPEPYQPPSV